MLAVREASALIDPKPLGVHPGTASRRFPSSVHRYESFRHQDSSTGHRSAGQCQRRAEGGDVCPQDGDEESTSESTDQPNKIQQQDLSAAADELLAAAGQTKPDKAAKKSTTAKKNFQKAASKTTASKTTAAKGKPARSSSAKSKTGAKASAATAKAKEAAAKAAVAPLSPEEKAKAAAAEKEAKAKALASIKIGPKGVYTEDSIRVYLQEIGRIRLLRPDEEIELARKIADLLHLEELAAQFESDNGKYPDTKEWAAQGYASDLFPSSPDAGASGRKRQQSNLRFVVSIAKKYMNRYQSPGSDSGGQPGPDSCGREIRSREGYKFSTYATW